MEKKSSMDFDFFLIFASIIRTVRNWANSFMGGTKKTQASDTPLPREPRANALGSPEQQTQITQKLRELYDSVQDEGIPDRFLDLLEKLDEAEKAANASAKK